jgi:hypothetical protein
MSIANSVLSDEVQLGLALEAFNYAHSMGEGWAVRNLLYFRNAGINSMADLQQGCTQNTINLDLELFGMPELLQEETIAALRSFLPGPVGFRCFRLAQKAATKVSMGTADTNYVHRPENGKKGEEEWTTPMDGNNWTLNVDCAGFVRNCLKHVTKDPFRMLLSDRDFMRAKDFYGFFSTIPYTVMDPTEIPESDRRMKWRIVPDLRMVIPGDVIVYRPQGNAAGGAAFTRNDRKDLPRLLKAVKAAQLFREMKQEWEHMGGGSGTNKTPPRNVAKDSAVQPWVDAVSHKLQLVGITTVRELRQNLDRLNALLTAAQCIPLSDDTIALMRECAATTALNTGHIVFAAGIACHKGNNSYRIRVVHSTKFGKKDENGVVTEGVQEHYRRFQLVQDPVTGREFWTRQSREGAVAAAIVEQPQQPVVVNVSSDRNNPSSLNGNGAISDDDIDNPNDDMEDDEVAVSTAIDVDTTQSSVEVDNQTLTLSASLADESTLADEIASPTDELSGQSEIVVLAARMCF